jgi:hypothetical protein
LAWRSFWCFTKYTSCPHRGRAGVAGSGVTVGSIISGIGGILIGIGVGEWIYFKKDQPIGKPKDGLPPGTKGIDEAGLTKDQVHGIKEGIGAGAADWVGIDPEGNVWTGTRDGAAENHGPWRPYVP